MARYLVKELSFINGGLVQPGSVIEFDGEAGSHMELVEEAEAPKAKKVAKAAKADEANPELL